MTRSEFIQKAAIALLSNSRFLNSNCTVDTQGIIGEADKLYKEIGMETDFECEETEEPECMLTRVRFIADELVCIKEAMEAPNGGELSAFQEMVSQMSRMTEKLTGCLRDLDTTLNEKMTDLIENLNDIRKGTDSIGNPDFIEPINSISGSLCMIQVALEDIRDSVADE